MLRGVEAGNKSGVADLSANLQSMGGGLEATARAPLADLRSTFTGGWTLAEIAAPDRVDSAEALAYAKALERPEGGFHGGHWDGGFDVEYTFYGLGTVALLDVIS